MSSVTEEGGLEPVERILATVEDPHNQGVLRRYLEERQATGVKVTTLANDANHLRDLARFLGSKPVEDVGKEDLIKFVNQRERERVWRNGSKNGEVTVTRRKVKLNDTTLKIRRVIVRAFFKWLRGTDDYPEEVKWLGQVKTRAKDSIPTDKILNADEIEQMIQATADPRERAAVAILAESGLRAGEFCALNVGSVERDDYGAILVLPKKATGLKTGSRRVRILRSGSWPYLYNWLEVHPFKDAPDAPLFFTTSHRAPKARFTPNSLYTFVRRVSEKAGVKKRIGPHTFRHTAATQRAKDGWNEFDMRAYFGWTRSSDMPSHYTHLAGRDYDYALLRREGLIEENKGETRRPLRPKACRACGVSNMARSDFCKECNAPISPAAEKQIEQKKQAYIHEQIAEQSFLKSDELAEALAGQVLGRNEEMLEILAAKVVERLKHEQDAS